MLTHSHAPRQLRPAPRSLLTALPGLALALLLGLGLALAAPSANAADQPRELNWEDLIPEPGTPPPPLPPFPGQDLPGQLPSSPRPPSDSGLVSMFPYNPVQALDGKYVKLPGYIVPLESDEGGLLDEFLLVPYYGACIHVPPPPPNQVVYVRLKKPFFLKSMEEPFWITGTMTTRPWTGDMADSDYVLDGDRVEVFEWEE